MSIAVPAHASPNNLPGVSAISTWTGIAVVTAAGLDTFRRERRERRSARAART